MALIIRKSTPLGVDATYWRISSYQLNIDGREFSCVLHGHIDEGTYLKGALPLTTIGFVVRYETNGNEQFYSWYLGQEQPFRSALNDMVFPVEVDRHYLYELLLNNVPFFCGAENG